MSDLTLTDFVERQAQRRQEEQLFTLRARRERSRRRDAEDAVSRACRLCWLVSPRRKAAAKIALSVEIMLRAALSSAPSDAADLLERVDVLALLDLDLTRQLPHCLSFFPSDIDFDVSEEASRLALARVRNALQGQLLVIGDLIERDEYRPVLGWIARFVAIACGLETRVPFREQADVRETSGQLPTGLAPGESDNEDHAPGSNSNRPTEPAPAGGPVQPKAWLRNWHQITEVLGQPYRDYRKIRELNNRMEGPIRNSGQGTCPLVDRDALLEWWNHLDVCQQDLANQREGAGMSAEASYPYGRDGHAAPEIAGGVKKRRRDKRT